jgi:hypothetical protein
MSRADIVVSASVADELRDDNAALRRLLCVFHVCPGGMKNCTGGELRCSGSAEGHDPVDFRCDTVDAIEDALTAPSLRFIQAHQDDVCRHCGVTRWSFHAGTAPCHAIEHEWVSNRPERTE